jgi:hypothetical protein
MTQLSAVILAAFQRSYRQSQTDKPNRHTVFKKTYAGLGVVLAGSQAPASAGAFRFYSICELCNAGSVKTALVDVSRRVKDALALSLGYG